MTTKHEDDVTTPHEEATAAMTRASLSALRQALAAAATAAADQSTEDAEYERAMAAAAALEDDPAAVAENVEDLADVGFAADDVRRAEAILRARVELARAHGRSWQQIATSLGVSKQAAWARYGRPDD